ncbi:hypothetical protein [Halegenticoccus tardaugens]|uniref:hypothetical protein n=1 Tax=Halegenticoccus tardaugens TaxID=2071624 RepID=UPI00100B5E2E|nr:hypothetical protein [Halegenticoccus tardaugens]
MAQPPSAMEETASTRVKGTVGRLRPGNTRVRAIFNVFVAQALFYSVVVGNALAQQSGPVVMQTGGVCGTPIGDALNASGPLIVETVMIGGFLAGVVAHAASGIYKNPEKRGRMKDWRNGALAALAGAPIVAYLVEEVVGAIGWDLASCVNLFPF